MESIPIEVLENKTFMNLKKINNGLSYLRLLMKRKKIVINNLENWSNSLSDPTEYYLDAFRFYHLYLPSSVREQKRYFRKDSRGFGEMAFHTMWYLLFEKFRFDSFLEIGVYRGQIIHLIGLMAKAKKKNIFLCGISPFDSSADAVSGYKELDYYNDVLNHFHVFDIEEPKLLRAYSTDQISKEFIASRDWDCIYIDGSHDLEVVQQDWLLCRRHVKIGGIIVMDDASLYTKFETPFFAFKGHPGPSVIADSICKNDHTFREILRVGHNRVFERLV